MLNTYGGNIRMSNKSLEIVKHWIDNQRMSFERKVVLEKLIDDAVREAEDDVRREMKKKIEDIEYEHMEKIKEMNTPSNAFVAMLKQTLEEHPDIIKDTSEDVIRSIAEEVASAEVESHVSAEHCSDCEYV